MTGRDDGYGAMLLAALEDDPRTVEIVEREDGFISASVMGPKLYFAPFQRWPPHHRRAMRFVRGRVLDVGCGAGRVCLHLQERREEVVGIDVSAGAVEELERLLEGTGWRLSRRIDSDDTYIAVIDKA